MRVLMVIGQYAPTVGGAERQCALLARALVARGHAVRVLTVRPDRGVPMHAVCDGIPVERVAYPIMCIAGHRWGMGFLAFPLLLWRAWRLLATHDVGIAHQALWPAFAAAVAAQARHRPMIVKIGNSGARFDLDVLRQSHWYGAWGARLLARRVARFIATSTAVHADLVAAGIPAARIVDIPNGVPLPSPVARRSSGVLRCAFVGTLTAKKNVAVFLDALAMLSPETRSHGAVTIAGDGPLRSALTARAAARGVADCVTFAGTVADVPALLAQQDCFVLPSQTEGLSNAALEAAAAGLPLLLSAAGGNFDLVPDAAAVHGEPFSIGATGVLVPSGDASALSAALQWMATHPEERQRMGGAAHALVAARYAIDRVAQQYDALCTTVAPPRPLRVVHLLTFLDTQTGGMERQARQIAERLREDGRSAFFITSAHVATMRREHLPLIGERWGFRVYRIPFVRGWRQWNAAVYLASALLLLIALRKRYDVIHAYQLQTSGLVASIARRLLPHTRVIVKNSCSGLYGDVGGLRRWSTSALRHGIDRFIGISGETVAEMGAIGCGPVVHIPNGVRTDRFAPPSTEERVRARRAVLGSDHATLRLVLSVGRLNAQKNLTTLVDAVAALDEETVLCIVGDGPERVALARYRVQRGVAQRVRFAGAVADVLPYYHAADVFVFSSRSEGMPNAVLEAMACGLPIVASTISPIREIIRDGTDGILVDPQDTAGFTLAIRRVLEHAGDARRMAAQTRSRAVAEYGLDAVAQRYAALYDSLTTG